MSKRIQLGLYALLCLCVALAVFFLPMKNRFVLLFIYTILFLIAMLFDHRGMMHSVSTAIRIWSTVWPLTEYGPLSLGTIKK